MAIETQVTIETPETPETQATPAIRRGSVVREAYKAAYRDRGDATNCGDWLATTLKPLVPYIVVNGKLAVDVETLDARFAENGIDSTVGKWGRALHDPEARTAGWEGRFAMSGRNILRRKVEAAGKLVWEGRDYFPIEEEPTQEC